MPSRSQDGNDKGGESSLGKELDWLGEGLVQAWEGLRKRLVSVKEYLVFLKLEVM